MKREIKFRAWGIDGIKGPKLWNWDHIRGCFECWLMDETAIIMQFTGVFDKNGKEIYEGDIIKFKDLGRVQYAVCKNEFGYEFEWHQGGYTFKMENDCILGGTVVGNIYENPELVKE